MSRKGTLGRKGKHWSQRVREIVVVKSANGSFNVCIEGGAENGEFARIGNFKQDKVKYKQGKLHVNDVILEVNDVAIAGYTLPDVVSLIKKTGDVLKMQVVKPGKFCFTHPMTCQCVQYMKFFTIQV
jgi:C-terminal processing protease CtpA/Prc